MRAENFLNLLYPRCCPLCHEILREQKRLLCPECEKKIRPVSGARCMKCGRQVDKEAEYCRDCGKRKRNFTQGKGIFPYDDMWKLSIEKYKYYGCREYGKFYAEAMLLFGEKNIIRWKPDRLIPVPLHRKKERRRGFNQSAYIAEQLSLLTGIPCDGEIVKKCRNTKSQKKLNAQERRNNLKNAFIIRKNVKDFTLLIIDDVYTTGSTMDEISACLMAGGAKKVYFLTLCMGNP